MRRAEFDLAAERQLRAEFSRKRVRLPRKHKRGVLAYRSEKGVSAPWLRRLPELALLDVLAVDNVCARVMRQLDCAAAGACLFACRDLGSAVAVHADWQALCAEMWADKVFVPAKAEQLLRANRGREAFTFALEDSARTVIALEELVSMIWQTRAKAALGQYAVDTDPRNNLGDLQSGFLVASASAAVRARHPVEGLLCILDHSNPLLEVRAGTAGTRTGNVPACHT